MEIKLKKNIGYLDAEYDRIDILKYNDGNLAVILKTETSDPSYDVVISVNLASGFTYAHKDAFFADLNNVKGFVFEALEEQGLIEKSTYSEQSGFVVYPAYFVAEDIAEIFKLKPWVFSQTICKK